MKKKCMTLNFKSQSNFMINWLRKENLNNEMKIQADQEFAQNKTKILNKKNNIHIFNSKVRGGKTFAAEQKIREIKKLLFKSKALDKKLTKRIRSTK